ncbi:uncharacterized protein TEOVI_000392400 [Trypanosoma equiperdum]|uniref:Uncharacterized protein n=2 Tax=Trypanozoon TaxID=39700 RepID=A0A1G4IIM2_TRYEQ|nr:hypothetical protein DPX39_070057300 [Trypanosoma brucei equiperdum]SCU72348.1 hypothetical protein TEOVI_000392400 [Trypanosoma equiperdum]
MKGRGGAAKPQAGGSRGDAQDAGRAPKPQAGGAGGRRDEKEESGRVDELKSELDRRTNLIFATAKLPKNVLKAVKEVRNEATK